MSDTQALLYAIGIYVVFLLVIFWNYGQFTKTIVRWSRKPIKVKNSNKLKQPPLTIGEALKCYIPYYQACLVRKSLYRTAGIFPIIAIISAVGIILNIVNKFVYAINGYVMFIMSIVMIVCTILFWLLYAIITADCAKMYGFSWFVIIMCFVFPHLACTYLHNNVPTKMRAIHKEEVFSEHNGNTVIKQRHNE